MAYPGELVQMVQDEGVPENVRRLILSLERFEHLSEVRQWISELPPTVASGDEHQLELLRQKYEHCLDLYQEQPHLLDPYLADLLADLLQLIRDPPGQKAEVRLAAAAFAEHLVKVRHPKVMVRHFPHEVHHLEPVLALLEQQRKDTSELKATYWESDYMFLLWMSMLALIPFDLKRFDSGVERPVTERILASIKHYLAYMNKSQEAAAFLAARFLTRPDVLPLHLESFFDWALAAIANRDGKSPEPLGRGALMAIAGILKQGKRDDLLPFSLRLLEAVQGFKLMEAKNLLLRKLHIKVVQRVGLVFLKSKVAKWRYQRGNRSLALNLNTAQVKPSGGPGAARVDASGDDEEDYDIPDELEDVIEEMLCGLRDRDTVVRWAAAKGIGRVTGRLPKELADDVVGSLLELFSLRETDGAWHGGCLALAELGRRGLLLPQRLPEVVGVVLRALVYDEKKGNFSVGAHIRDAACYVCWAFARAYDPDVLKPHVNAIASALLIVTVFDREVNCRRSASAAFQENVGRQGTFPNGIDILTKADYFAVGSRNHSYLELSVFVAGFPSYTDPLIDHLVEKKIGHWDVAVRELTAHALRNLAHIAPDKMVKEVLRKLLKISEGIDLFAKHGSIIAIGAIISGLGDMIQAGKLEGAISDVLGRDLFEMVKRIAFTLVEKMSLRMTGGDLLRQAITLFIEDCAKAKLPVHGDEKVIGLWQVILNENLSHKDPHVQDKAVQTMPYFLKEYLRLPDGDSLMVGRRDVLLSDYIGDLNTSELHQRGYALALGGFPAFALKGKVGEILKSLIQATEVTSEKTSWAEGRRDCVVAISNILRTVGVTRVQDDLSVGGSTLVAVSECFLTAITDYTLDRRGDVGAWVREAGMTAITDLIKLVMQTDPELAKNDCSCVIREMMSKLAQQACEKIDRTRGLAVRLFSEMINFTEPAEIPGIYHVEEIRGFFPRNMDDFGWSIESETFPVMVKLLRYEEYRKDAITGLSVSVGGLTERLVKYSSAAVFDELKTFSDEALDIFSLDVVDVLKKFHKVDRVSIPMFKFLDQLLSSGSLDPVLESESSQFPSRLLDTVKAEVTKCTDPVKLMLACDVLCALLPTEDKATMKKALVQLSIFLCHRFPRVRKAAANKLFEALITYSDKDIVDLDQLEEVNEILCDTDWGRQNVEALRPIRNSLCDLLKVPAPAVIKKVVG